MVVFLHGADRNGSPGWFICWFYFLLRPDWFLLSIFVAGKIPGQLSRSFAEVGCFCFVFRIVRTFMVHCFFSALINSCVFSLFRWRHGIGHKEVGWLLLFFVFSCARLIIFLFYFLQVASRDRSRGMFWICVGYCFSCLSIFVLLPGIRRFFRRIRGACHFSGRRSSLFFLIVFSRRPNCFSRRPHCFSQRPHCFSRCCAGFCHGRLIVVVFVPHYYFHLLCWLFLQPLLFFFVLFPMPPRKQILSQTFLASSETWSNVSVLL